MHKGGYNENLWVAGQLAFDNPSVTREVARDTSLYTREALGCRTVPDGVPKNSDFWG